MTAISERPNRKVSAADIRPTGATAGMIAGPLFLLTVALLTWADLGDLHHLGWHYTKVNNVPWPSGLALGSQGWIQCLNFAVTGLLLLTFVRAFRHELAGVAGRIGTVLLTVLGLALTLSAFPTDHATAAGKSPDTWHGVIHSAAFIGVALPAILAPGFVAFALRRNPRWRSIARISAPLPLLLLATFPLGRQIGDVSFTAFLVLLFGWIAMLAARLKD